MPIFTFSTRTKVPTDTEAVERAKQHCEKHHINFSAIVVNLLKDWEREQREAKVQSNI